MERTKCDSEDELNSLKITKLISLFVVLSSGAITSLIVLGLEAIFKKIRSKQQFNAQSNSKLVTIKVGKSKIQAEAKL